MANPELGAKQICPNCQTKFYDLGRRPAACPKCATSFDPEEALRSRRVRARAAPADYEDDAEEVKKPVVADEPEGFEDEPEETPEIDEAVEAEPVEADETDDAVPGAPEAPEPDLGVDFEEEAAIEDDAEDVPFIEEDDEDFPDDDLELPAEETEER